MRGALGTRHQPLNFMLEFRQDPSGGMSEFQGTVELG